LTKTVIFLRQDSKSNELFVKNAFDIIPIGLLVQSFLKKKKIPRFGFCDYIGKA